VYSETCWIHLTFQDMGTLPIACFEGTAKSLICYNFESFWRCFVVENVIWIVKRVFCSVVLWSDMSNHACTQILIKCE
jgi:hypothetical protein